MIIYKGVEVEDQEGYHLVLGDHLRGCGGEWEVEQQEEVQGQVHNQEGDNNQHAKYHIY